MWEPPRAAGPWTTLMLPSATGDLELLVARAIWRPCENKASETGLGSCRQLVMDAAGAGDSGKDARGDGWGSLSWGLSISGLSC